MSQKLNSKNLSYNASLPPFLAALKSQVSGSSSSPNPLLTGQRRHGTKRSASAEAEDAPLVVDEEGNVVDAQVGLDGTVTVSGKGPEAAEGDGVVGEGADAKVGAKAGSGVVSAIGRKRKTAKVIGGDADEDGADRADAPKSSKTKVDKADQTKTSKPKKKAKKIKLSFDE